MYLNCGTLQSSRRAKEDTQVSQEKCGSPATRSAPAVGHLEEVSGKEVENKRMSSRTAEVKEHSHSSIDWSHLEGVYAKGNIDVLVMCPF